MNIHVFTYLSRRLILIIAALFITVLSATANNGSRTPVFSTEDAPVWMLIHSAQNHYIHANYASSRNLWYVASTAEPAIFRPDMQWCFIGSQSGFIIKNINGMYIKQHSGSTGSSYDDALQLTTSREEAQTFVYDWANKTSDTDTWTWLRPVIDNTVKALSMRVGQGSSTNIVTFRATDNNSRVELFNAAAPAFQNDNAELWYAIRYKNINANSEADADRRYLTSTHDNSYGADAKNDPNLVWAQWQLVSVAEEGTSPYSAFLLQNYNGYYLRNANAGDANYRFEDNYESLSANDKKTVTFKLIVANNGIYEIKRADAGNNGGNIAPSGTALFSPIKGGSNNSFNNFVSFEKVDAHNVYSDLLCPKTSAQDGAARYSIQFKRNNKFLTLRDDYADGAYSQNDNTLSGTRWQLVGETLDNVKLLNDKDYYLKFDGTHYIMTEDEADATSFQLIMRAGKYFEIKLSEEEYDYKTGKSLALSNDNVNAVIETNNNCHNRNYVSFEPSTGELHDDYPEILYRDGDINKNEWYNIQFDNGKNYLAEYGYDSGAFLSNVTTVKATQWQFVGNAQEFKMVNKEGFYLTYNGNRYVGTTDETLATSFEMVAGLGGTWKIKDGNNNCIGENSSNFNDVIFRRQINNDNVSLNITKSTGNGDLLNPCTMTIDEATPHWYQIQFEKSQLYVTNLNGEEVKNQHWVVDDNEYSTCFTQAFPNLKEGTWAFVGDGYTSFKIKNYNGFYLKFDSAKKTFLATDDVNEAESFKFVRTSANKLAIKRIAVNNNNEAMSTDAKQGSVVSSQWNEADGNLIKLIAVQETNLIEQPHIIHKQNYLINYARENDGTVFLQNDQGWFTNEYTGDSIQNVSVFRVDKYLKRGVNRTIYLPTIQGTTAYAFNGYYQRWYNYETEGPVDRNVVDLYNKSLLYPEGHVMGSHVQSVTGGQLNASITVKLPATYEEDCTYVLAADLSRFTDYEYRSGTWDKGDIVEPSLNIRVIYELHDANIIAKKLSECTGDKWLEEKTIHYPKQSVGFTSAELLGLENEVENYFYYKAAPGSWSEDNLTQLDYNKCIVSLGSNPAGITVNQKLRSVNANNRSRFLQFLYPKTNGVNIAQGDSAYIYVRAVDGDYTYNIAKYLVYFDEEPVLPYTDILGKTEEGNWKSGRSPYAMMETYGEPTARIDFDFPDTQPYVTPDGVFFHKDHHNNPISTTNSAPTPLSFAKTTYFFDYYGAPGDGGDNKWWENQYGSYSINRRLKATWGASGIFKTINELNSMIMGEPTPTLSGDKAGFFYVDASEQPGKVANVAFHGDITCTGVRLVCTGWMGSLNNPSGNTAGGSIILNVDGIMIDPVTKEETRTTLYSYCPGQLSYQGRKADGKTVVSNGVDGEAAVWQQFYFNFMITKQYDRYELDIDNNCFSTSGGDYLLDDIYVYVLSPQIQMGMSTPVCADEVQHALIDAEFAQILSSTGTRYAVNKEESSLVSVTYGVLDADVYDQQIEAVNQLSTQEERYALYKQVFRNSIVGEYSINQPRSAFHNFTFSTYFQDDEVQPEYNMYHAIGKLRDGTVVTPSTVYRRVQNETQMLVFNDKFFDALWVPGKRYYLIFSSQMATNEDIENNQVDELFSLLDECSAKEEFISPAPYIMLGDLESKEATDRVFACIGQTPTISMKLYTIDDSGKPTTISNLHYDWWLGNPDQHANRTNFETVADTIQTENGPDIVTLKGTLELFRELYPGDVDLNDVVPNEQFEFSQHMIDYLKRLTADNPKTGRPDLYLYRTSVNMKMYEEMIDTFWHYSPEGEKLEEFDRVIYYTTQPVDDEAFLQVMAERQIVVYCAKPQTMSIQLDSEAPTLKNGMDGLNYPGELSVLSLRISKSQVEEIQNGKSLVLPLRDIHTVSDGALGVKENPQDTNIYLSETTDINYEIEDDDPDSGHYLRTVGSVVNIHGDISTPADEKYAKITLDPEFKFREGYNYTLKMPFIEKVPDSSPTSCPGDLLMMIKIVPDYEVWTGAAGNTDWNNDKNWRRADRNELYAGKGGLNDYETNEENTTSNGFVPLYVTHALITDSINVAAPVMYHYGEDVDGFPILNGHTCSKYLNFDLLAYKKENDPDNIYCEQFHTNNCDGLALQSEREILNTHFLDYDKVWMEYKIYAHGRSTDGVSNESRWQLFSSPIQTVYSGEWYAPSDNGMQQTTYFHDVTYNEEINNRYKPAIYQRGWDKAHAYIYYVPDEFSGVNYGGPGSAGTSELKEDGIRDVIILGDWSGAYNDVTVDFSHGGFAIKPITVYMETPADSLIIRLPKEDTFYDYYDISGTQKAWNTNINHNEFYHKLFTDNIKNPANPNSPAPLTFTFTNEKSDNNFFLVGNPFPCGLDMAKFLNANSELIDPMYWIMTEDHQMVIMKEDDGTWISSDQLASRQTGIVAARQGFFVKKKTDGNTLTDLTFTADMMCQAIPSKDITTVTVDSTFYNKEQTESLTKTLKLTTYSSAVDPDGTKTVRVKARGRLGASVNDNMLCIRATRNGLSTSAVVRIRENADNNYDISEDAPTFIESTSYELPNVYTMAGRNAAAINTINQLTSLPLGIYSSDNTETELTFTGTDNFGQLYLQDMVEDTTIPIAEGEPITVSGNSHGRYLIVTSPKAKENISESDILITQIEEGVIRVTSVGNDMLTNVNIYSIDGKLVESKSALNSKSATFHLPTGMYLVRGKTEKSQAVKKVLVR